MNTAKVLVYTADASPREAEFIEGKNIGSLQHLEKEVEERRLGAKAFLPEEGRGAKKYSLIKE